MKLSKKERDTFKRIIMGLYEDRKEFTSVLDVTRILIGYLVVKSESAEEYLEEDVLNAETSVKCRAILKDVFKPTIDDFIECCTRLSLVTRFSMEYVKNNKFKIVLFLDDASIADILIGFDDDGNVKAFVSEIPCVGYPANNEIEKKIIHHVVNILRENRYYNIGSLQVLNDISKRQYKIDFENVAKQAFESMSVNEVKSLIDVFPFNDKIKSDLQNVWFVYDVENKPEFNEVFESSMDMCSEIILYLRKFVRESKIDEDKSIKESSAIDRLKEMAESIS